MDTSRLGRGQLLAGVSALLLFVFMFFSWFSLESGDVSGISLERREDFVETYPEAISVTGDVFSLNAWQALGLIEIVLLLLTVICGLGFAALALTAKSPRLPVPPGAVVAVLGILSTLLVAYRLIDPISFFGRSLGLFLALLAAIGVAAGGLIERSSSR